MIRPQEHITSTVPYIYATCFHCETDVGVFFGQVHTNNGIPVCDKCKDKKTEIKKLPPAQKPEPTNDMCALRKSAYKVLKEKGVAWVDVCKMKEDEMRKAIG